ncbi:MAG: PIG-L family deacetylase [Deltaproteobacteria bacterium]|nr:PIG-L family deacetylase [Deltaproteobacteria bacterium]
MTQLVKQLACKELKTYLQRVASAPYQCYLIYIMDPKLSQVMVITPHPDDAEIGAAGTLALWISGGKSIIYVVCLTRMMQR